MPIRPRALKRSRPPYILIRTKGGLNCNRLHDIPSFARKKRLHLLTTTTADLLVSAQNLFSFTFSWWNRVISAHNACVKKMVTVMIFPASVTTSSNTLLVTATLDIVHPNGEGFVSCTKVTHTVGSRKVEHVTNNVSLLQAPVIITDCSPLLVIIHFNTTLMRGT